MDSFFLPCKADNPAARIPYFAFFILALALVGTASCASTRSALIDDLPPDSEKGYVCFYTGEEGDSLTLSITRVRGDETMKALRVGDAWSGIGDFRIACPPGMNDFIVQPSNSETRERIRIDVPSGEMRAIGFRTQETGYSKRSVGLDSTLTISYWKLRTSVGTSILPSDPASKDPEPWIAALSDRDWGTRALSLRALTRLKSALGPEKIALVQELAIADPIRQVRTDAQILLSVLRLPVPTQALYLESFESNRNNQWVESPASDPYYRFHPDGYSIGSKNESSHWITVDLPETVEKKGDFDIRLDCSWISGDDSMPFGLILGKDSKTFMHFSVSRNGGAIIGSYRGDEYRVVLPWTQNAAAAITAAQGGRIVVSRKGPMLTVHVNGILVGTAQAPEDIPITAMGLFVGGAQDIVFHTILITSPK